MPVYNTRISIYSDVPERDLNNNYVGIQTFTT